ncbi:quinon protein alcohol dehydrogenase-like superfamily [Aspergillus germanicus]
MFIFHAIILTLSACLLYQNRSLSKPNTNRIYRAEPTPSTPLLSQEAAKTEISAESITIAIFCVLVYEAVAIEQMLDEEYTCHPEAIGQINYVYSFGRINEHRIVIAQPHQVGTVAAAQCATAVSHQFPNIRFALMVGIGAGMPNLHDIRLGDIAISTPQDSHAGRGFVLKGCLNKPPSILISADKWLTREELKDRRPLERALERITKIPSFSRPNTDDILFDDKFHHINKGSGYEDCETSNEKLVTHRPNRQNKQPVVHRGLILSGNGVIKNPRDRDYLQRYTDAICFEMEAAGIMDEIPCLIVRGICDYADTHKQDGWHFYAAAVAAAYCRMLLCKIDSRRVKETDSRFAEGVERLKEIASELRDAQRLEPNYPRYERTLDLKELKIVQGAEFDSYENQHEDCLEGTRVDLLRELEEWSTLPGGKCIFWLNGNAGTGKSTISRTAASLLKKKGLLDAGFFFKRGEGDRGSAKKLFPTLAAQLVNTIPQPLPFIQTTIKSTPQISDKILGEQFEKLLLQPLLETDQRTNTITTRVIVIDAPDECQGVNDTKLILKLLPRVRKLITLKLQFLLTSRPELPSCLDLSLHQIPEPIIEHDICLYFEIRFAKLRNRRSLPQDWPGGEKIKALVQHSVPLFISASTIYRFISDDRWNPEKRMQAILANTSIYVSKMHSTYIIVLRQLLVDQDEQDSRQLVQKFRELIGIVILLATPLSVVTISQLVHMDLDSINNLLRLLHSVLEVPRDPCIPVHTILAKRCLKIMDQMLKKNICDLPHSGIQRSELNAQSIDHSLPPKLQYACRYWAEHLTLCKDPAAELSKAFQILRVHFLHWVEAMSILGYISEVVEIFRRLQSTIQSSTCPDLIQFFHDTRRFILKNRQMAEAAPLQLYSSVMFNSELSHWHRLPKVEETWSAELQNLGGHLGMVESVRFSPDARLLASSSDDRTVRLWNSSTGELYRIFEGNSNVYSSVVFSPNSQHLAANSEDQTIQIWDTATGELQRTLRTPFKSIQSIAFSPDGQFLALGFGRIIGLLDPNTGKLCRYFKGHSHSICSIAFSPNGQLLASGSMDNTVKIRDAITRKLYRTLKGHHGTVNSVAFSPNGQLLASGSDDETIKIWDASTGELYHTLDDYIDWVKSVDFSTDGRLLASGSDDGTIKIWDTKTGELQKTLLDYSGPVSSVAFSPDGPILASGSIGTIKLWDPSIGELQESFDGNPLSDTWITSIDFSPDGKLLASCSNHSLSIWDTSTGELWQILEGHSDTAEIVAFCPKGCLLASRSRDKTTSQIHDNHSDTVASISYSPDTRLLASCSGELRRILQGHSDKVNAPDFTADSQLLASGSDDKSIKLFDVGTEELKQTFKSHDRVALVTFSSVSRLLAASSFISTELWVLTTGELLQTLEGQTNWTWLEKKGGIFILEHQWLCVEGERRLWLPEDYRPTCLALNGNVLALGHRNGRISYVASDTFC